MGDNSPRFPLEKNIYTVLAIVKDYFAEEDGDIHIVLQDINHPSITIIVEMPDMIVTE